jgi:hypothetical protein
MNDVAASTEYTPEDLRPPAAPANGGPEPSGS